MHKMNTNITQKTKDEQHGLHLKQEVNPGVKGKTWTPPKTGGEPRCEG
jgi:hypothetical protein